MHQPPDFFHKTFPHYVCKLHKALYCLNQTPQAWYHRFSTFLQQIGFKIAKSDPSLFIYQRESQIAYLLLYVDDIILVTSSAALRSRLISQLQDEFPMTDFEPLSYFLGIIATRNSSSHFLSQSQYAHTTVERSRMASCKLAATPVDTTSKLNALSSDPVLNPTLYRSLVGALQCLTFTCPDITYNVQQVCLFLHDPHTSHLEALKSILRYFHGTLSYGSTLYSSAPTSLIT